MKYFIFIAALSFLSCTFGFAGDAHQPYQDLIDNPGKLSDSSRLAKLFQVDWDRSVRESPEFATDLGYPGYDDLWTDMSEPAIAQRKAEAQWPVDVLNTIHRDSLSAADQLNFDLFAYNAKTTIEENEFPGQYLALNQLGGVQQTIPQVIEQMHHATVMDYEHILARISAAPALIDQNISLLKDGVKAGVTEPKIILQDVPAQVLKVVPDDPDSSPILSAFKSFPPSISASDQARLKSEATKSYKAELLPAYHRLHDYLVQDYIPHARDSIAWSALPDGKAWYQIEVNHQTTTDMTPWQIHALGLAEVEKDAAEMKSVAKNSGFKGDYNAFKEFLQTDPQFYYTDAESLLAGYRNLAKKIDPVLPQFFGKLPRLTYGVKPIPAYAADSAPAAYYMDGSAQAGRPGYFCANTSSLPSRPKWQMAVLTLHESVPGHHLQISLAEEMEGVPEFRKYAGYTAFTEGWALYCERLGNEMGFYSDPYSKFGQLTFDMWRACRLVIDTGIHDEGWSRQQAIDYLMLNAGKDIHEATVEVDRYIASPGQALAYKIGQLKILALRAEATKNLGQSFDLRAFHDALLSNGSLPLPVLETKIHEWIATQTAHPAATLSP